MPGNASFSVREFDKKGVNIGVLAGFALLLSGIYINQPRKRRER